MARRRTRRVNRLIAAHLFRSPLNGCPDLYGLFGGHVAFQHARLFVAIVLGFQHHPYLSVRCPSKPDVRDRPQVDRLLPYVAFRDLHARVPFLKLGAGPSRALAFRLTSKEATGRNGGASLGGRGAECLRMYRLVSIRPWEHRREHSSSAQPWYSSQYRSRLCIGHGLWWCSPSKSSPTAPRRWQCGQAILLSERMLVAIAPRADDARRFSRIWRGARG